MLIFCDAHHLPYSVILPLTDANSLHSKIIQQQVKLSVPTKNQLWKQVIQHKIREQSLTLQLLDKKHLSIDRIAKKVKTGDKENHEAQAAQKYWHILMGNDFRRNPRQNEINALLNYGYAIIRAATARAIVSSGLHPALGLHHRNQYNGLCLADDLMEPFRPWVDYSVYQCIKKGNALKINEENKRILLGLLSQNVMWKDKKLPMMVACHHLMASLKNAYKGDTKTIQYPQLCSRIETPL